ncbi:replication factor A protein 1-like isoform X2 [Trifolium pratense]|nr:replication factor A protein 1-like isoform X2 [Trifolium pratense]
MDTSLSFSRLLSSSTTTSLLSPKTKTLSSNFTLPLKLNRFNPKPLRFSTSSKISATISVGDKLPESTFSYLDPAGEVQTITVSDLTKGKKAVLFAVPGAFTPTCSQKHCQLIMCDCSSLIGCFRFVFQKLCARKLILIMGILCGFVSSNWAESVIQFDFEMATQFDMLCDVLPGHNSWKFKVRVLRMWAISSFMKPNELNSMEMVLIDEKGGKIHALIRKELVYLFQNKLKEGEVYKLSNFDVVPVVGFYRTTLHPYKLIFRSNTKVQNFASSDIPILGFSFTDLAEVASYSVNYDYLIDVIGLISGISNEREYIRAGKVIKMVVLELTDNSGKCECALFGDHVDELQRLIGNCPSGLHVVALQFAKVKIFRGKVSIQDVMNTTRIFLDPEIKETSELRKG